MGVHDVLRRLAVHVRDAALGPDLPAGAVGGVSRGLR
jgi:hypothetical protein